MKSIEVLSLFDGMSCGQIALERAKIPVKDYYASEIDRDAIKVTKANYPKTKHIGDVTKVQDWFLPEIDLLIGGSPCQGFSFAGKQLNFEDPRSKLFFEYVRILKEVKPHFFLLENVKMKKEYQNIISEHLGVEPVLINSALVSAQNRERLYWANFKIEPPEDLGITLKDIVDVDKNRCIKHRIDAKVFGTLAFDKAHSNKRHLNQKSKALLTGGQQISNTGATNIVIDKDHIQILNALECERLQTVPENYTNKGLIESKRMKMLGNGWTVDVIAHIFKQIPF